MELYFLDKTAQKLILIANGLEIKINLKNQTIEPAKQIAKNEVATYATDHPYLTELHNTQFEMRLSKHGILIERQKNKVKLFKVVQLEMPFVNVQDHEPVSETAE